jgi:hypothetical protein
MTVICPTLRTFFCTSPQEKGVRDCSRLRSLQVKGKTNMEGSIDWLTLAEVAARAGLSETEVRERWGRFERYMCGRNFGDIVKYPPQAVELILATTTLYRTGWNTEDISEFLHTMFADVATAVGLDRMEQGKASLLTLEGNKLECLGQLHQAVQATRGCQDSLAHLATRMALLLETDDREPHRLNESVGGQNDSSPVS